MRSSLNIQSGTTKDVIIIMPCIVYNVFKEETQSKHFTVPRLFNYCLRYNI